MADLYKFVRHLLKYEAGISEDFEYPEKEKKVLAPLFQDYRQLIEMNAWGIPSHESVQGMHKLIDYAIKRSVSNHKKDPGGLTVCGITQAAWDEACRDNLFVGIETEFTKMSSVHWILIVRRHYWDVWKADNLVSQDLAEQVVDFYFHSGISATKKIQKLLNVVPDGIVGPKTLRALQYANSPLLCSQIKRARLDYILALSRKDKYSAFAYGWLRRFVDW